MHNRRIFISTVSHEFLTCRERLAVDLRFPDLDVQTQEQNITTLAAGQTILIKLDDYIARCDAVIHFIGRQSSKDGRVASEAAVDDLLDRHPDLPAVLGLSEADLRQRSYTQWEAWLAYYHRKTKRPGLKLVIAKPATSFKADNDADATTAGQQQASQKWHEVELKKRGRYSEILFTDAKELSIAVLRALKDILPAQQTQQIIAETRLISRHTAADFLGREKELALLDAAWSGPQPTNLLSIIAWGGVGKTALLAYWVQSRFIEKGWLDAQGQPDPIAYFDWTFYDQGTRSDDATQAGAASVGSFFEKALEHFGDPEPADPQKKVGRLATLIQAQRSLLILDGLEPLQYPLNHPQAGQITDPDLRELLGLIVQRNPGLCLISSRQALTDFPSGGTSPTRQHDLEELPLECAVSLLRKMQITGTDEELQQAAEDYFCHALSLIVLGRFLFVKGGDIRVRKQIPLERANENRNQTITRNAWHVLEAYEQWLASPQGNATDGQALRLTGIFDRPASADCLAALRQVPAIPGLTDALVPLSDDAWNAVLLRLHEAHLIQLRFPPLAEESFALRPEPHQVALDAHPLIREYFAKQLREQQPEAFQAAHSRLFDHLCQTTEHQPANLEGLQPLYQAVVHGCLAGRHSEAVEKVYRDRILRGIGRVGFYSTKKLGAVGADLGAAAAFFDRHWSRLAPNLSEADQAWLFNTAALRLQALGRLTEAREPMRLATENVAREKIWKDAAICAANLSALELTLGLLEEAVASARRAIEFADQSGEAFERMVNRATAADVLHQRQPPHERTEVDSLFEEAETLQREQQHSFHLLYSLRGFQHCDLILSRAERAAWARIAAAPYCLLETSGGGAADMYEQDPRNQGTGDVLGDVLSEAERRAKQTLNVAKQNCWLLDIALDHLTLARVTLYRALLSPDQDATELATPEPEQGRDRPSPCLAALDGLRKASTLHHLPKALLTAALHHHLVGDPAAARRCLDEAQQIAERGPMPLYLADVHLHRARLFHDKAELAKARTLIEKHRYGRRSEELADAEAAAVHW